MKFFVYAVIITVAAAVIAGFFIVGSPAQERLRQFDAQRVNHLQMLQSEIVYYWQNKERLPKQLSDLADPIRGFQVPIDPATTVEYGYEVKGQLTFSLCASFSLPSEEVMLTKGMPIAPEPYGGVTQNWQHGTGYFCFDRTIDKDFYKLLKPIR